MISAANSRSMSSAYEATQTVAGHYGTGGQRWTWGDNGDMVFLEAAVVVGLVWLVVYGTIRVLSPPREQPRQALPPGQWQPAHYDVGGETRVVLQKVAAGGGHVIDEHVIATFRADDPDYDAKFLTAMSTARERRALFEAEEE
jgi:hypothetical protein